MPRRRRIDDSVARVLDTLGRGRAVVQAVPSLTDVEEQIQVLAKLADSEFDAFTAERHLEELAKVPVDKRHLPEHAATYPIFIARVALAPQVQQPALLAEAARLKVFPGRKLKEMQQTLARHSQVRAQYILRDVLDDDYVDTAEAWRLCKGLAQEPRILDRFAEALQASGTVGEARAGKLLYLVLTSRLLDRPVSGKIGGPSAAGKSSLVDSARRFFPDRACYALTAMSERALAYSTEPLAHRMLVLYEAAGIASDFANYLIRSLLSEGRLRYETVEKTKDGLRSRMIEREGPTGLVVTTTKVQLHPENETRLLTIPISDTRAQTLAVMQEAARQAAGEALTSIDLSPWHALQAWLATTDARVNIPFAEAIAERIPPVAIRLRRDFRVILSLIKAHALLHQASRLRDADGYILADRDDYTVVRDLVADLVGETAGASVSSTIRKTVQAVRDLQGPLADHGITVSDLARALDLDVSTAWRRAQTAIERGFLKNLEVHERRPAQLRTAASVPDRDTPLLPDPEEVCRFVCTGEGSDPACVPSSVGQQGSAPPEKPANAANLQTPLTTTGHTERCDPPRVQTNLQTPRVARQPVSLGRQPVTLADLATANGADRPRRQPVALHDLDREPAA